MVVEPKFDRLLMKKSVIVAIMPLFFVTAVNAEVTDNVISGSDDQARGTNVFDRLRESPFTLSLKVATRYISHGLEYGDAPAGFATLGYASHGFGAFVSGVYTFNGSHSEIELGVTYKWQWLKARLSDYYYPSEAGAKDRYFDMNNHTTGHWGELCLTATPFKFPLWMTVSSYLYGADKLPDGKQAYSSYAEIGYSYGFKGNNAISAVVGASLNRGFYSDYEDCFSVVNLMLRYDTVLDMGRIRLPVSGAYVLNPNKEKSYFTFSVSLDL